MNQILFADTSGWVALANPDDTFFDRAKRGWVSLKRTPTKFVTTDYVIDETLTHLMVHRGKQAATNFGRWILSSAVVEIVHVDETVWQDAWIMFQQYEDKGWAFTDCTSFIVMREMGIYTAYSFDKHFIQAGFQLWPEHPL